MEKLLAIVLFIIGASATTYVLYNAAKNLISNRLQKKLDTEHLRQARARLLSEPPPQKSISGENNLFLLRNKPK